MTTDDDTPTVDDALDAIRSLRTAQDDALHGVDTASDCLDASRSDAATAISQLGEAQEAVRQAQETVEELTYGDGEPGSDRSLDAAWDALERPYEAISEEMPMFLDTIEAALEAVAEGSQDHTTEVTLDGVDYELQLTRVGAAVDDDSDGPTFGGWLADVLYHTEVTIADLTANTALSQERVEAILNGDETYPVQVRDVADWLHDNGSIARAERDDIIAQHAADD